MKKSSSLPTQFKQQIQQLLGAEATTYFNSLDEEEVSSIRIHPLHAYSPEIDTAIIPWEEHGRYLSERPVFAHDPAWHGGMYYVQESSSMLTGYICKNLFHSPIVALDLCAAPGGKSTHLLDVLPHESLLVSNEIISKRNQILAENIQRWGNGYNIITKGESHEFASLEQFFDLVVIDAPCSGEGLFRRQAEAIEEWSEENVRICTERQENILNNILHSIKTGGYLCYSTCTYELSENEGQVQKLLDTGLFELIKIDIKDFSGLREGYIPGTVRCWSHLVKGSGFYISLLKKVAHTSESLQIRKKRLWNWKSSRKIPNPLEHFVQITQKYTLYQSGEFLRAFPQKYQYELSSIAENVSITNFGINLGKLNKEIFTPAHALIYSTLLHPDIPKYTSDDKTLALDFLRRKEIPVLKILKNGWAVFQWKNIPLGWIKQNAQRVNNYYPLNWMLRK
ncbi:MAG: hypothetical protein LC105_12430 [Chitinophagales bacterium]|nr:hypothetical protein [Chitinophagales bacterium]MCZ2394659.1 hypothetical protein [Chitinophagales bacterium]